MDQVDWIEKSEYSLTSSGYVSYPAITLAAGTTYSYVPAIKLSKSDTIHISIDVLTSDAVIEYGIMNSDGVLYYKTLDGETRGGLDFEISTSGNYYLTVINKSSKSVEVVISYWTE